MQLAVYRKDNRKRDLSHRWRRRMWLAAAGVVVCVCAFALYEWGDQLKTRAAAARAFVLDSPYFYVREIQVRGGNKVGGSEIVAMAGLRHGMNLWKIQPTVIEKKIAKHPWVRRVLVRREFPRRVVIEVEERKPKAIVAIGKLYYVDGDGVVFKEVGDGENVEFPLLTGLRPDELTATNPAIRNRIQDAIRLGELMAKDSHALSEIHFESSERLVLYTTAFPVALHMGSGDWQSKLQRLDRVLALWKGHENRLASLDMSFRDQVVARLRKAPQ
jgi:cell division septal protein FtsQ